MTLFYLDVNLDTGDASWVRAGHDPPKLPEGTVIALGTDGIWDARNENEEFFGKDHFRNILRKTAMLSAQEIVNAVLEELGSFCRGVPLDDDVTLVIIKVI